MTYKADLNHTQPISSIIDLETSLNVKADLNHTHTQFDNVSVHQGLNVASGLNLYMTATSDNSTTLKIKMEDLGSVYDGSTNGTHYYWLDVRDNDNSSVFHERVVKYTEGFKVLFRFPATAEYGGGGSLSVFNSKNYSAPILEWVTPTQGFDSELPRVDWVKTKIKSGIPNRANGMGITSAWPLSGWTNTLGDGYAFAYLPLNATSIIVQYSPGSTNFTSGGYVVVQQWQSYPGLSDANSTSYCNLIWFPVMSGYIYRCYSIKAPQGPGQSESARYAPIAAYFPIKV